ncbi:MULTISPECIES: flagellar export chaperone FlgN [Acidithrix]|uniref:FlgN protein n=1 Tax=Acidithrix ferrooxidans TaxID=1280514 RepID=A0A0D8HLI3_9ACTN|nr:MULTISPECIES: flagellar export chaperone FlgN [Acidithrix]KJF17936.1 FlgN protein [Acidithrix ferrooxidans]
MGYSELSQSLEYETALLEKLLFKLEEERLLVANERHHYLGEANFEIQAVSGEIKHAELRRAIASSEVCDFLEIDSMAPLSEIISATPEPWKSVFAEQRSQMLLVTARIAKAQNEINSLLAQRIALVEDVLNLIDSSGTTNLYGRNGRRSKEATISLLDGLL